MRICSDALVTIAVKMYDLQGNLLEATDDEGVQYLHGHADIFPRIEAALEGKAAGDTVSVIVEPEDSFGAFDDQAIFLVPVEQLGEPELIVPGLVFDHVPGQAYDGRNYRVTEVAQGMALMDANHPLAGWTLRFEVRVLAVSQTEGEQATGNDEVVVPDFLGFADKIIDDEIDDDPRNDPEALLAQRSAGLA